MLERTTIMKTKNRRVHATGFSHRRTLVARAQRDAARGVPSGFNPRYLQLYASSLARLARPIPTLHVQGIELIHLRD